MKIYYEFSVATMLFFSIFLIDVVIYKPNSNLMIYGIQRGNNSVLLGLCDTSSKCDALLCSASIKYRIEHYKCGSNIFPYTWLYIVTAITIVNSFILAICDYIGCYIHSFKISLVSILISHIFLILLKIFQTYYWKKVVSQEELYTVFQCIMIIGQGLIIIKIIIFLFR
jgi:hypothetical protein